MRLICSCMQATLSCPCTPFQASKHLCFITCQCRALPHFSDSDAEEPNPVAVKAKTTKVTAAGSTRKDQQPKRQAGGALAEEERSKRQKGSDADAGPSSNDREAPDSREQGSTEKAAAEWSGKSARHAQVVNGKGDKAAARKAALAALAKKRGVAQQPDSQQGPGTSSPAVREQPTPQPRERDLNAGDAAVKKRRLMRAGEKAASPAQVLGKENEEAGLDDMLEDF